MNKTKCNRMSLGVIGVATQAGWSEKRSVEVTLAWKGVRKMSQQCCDTGNSKCKGLRSALRLFEEQKGGQCGQTAVGKWWGWG